MKRLSPTGITRRMRTEVIYRAKRCEHWAGQARSEEDAGRAGAAICLAFVARQQSEAAFAAVAVAQAQLRTYGGANGAEQ